MPMSKPVRAAVSSLSDTILPLEEWVKSHGKLLPAAPLGLKLPWRNKDSSKPRLTVASLGFLDHLDSLLANDSSFIDAYVFNVFIERIAVLSNGSFPFGSCPIGEVEMRARRAVWGFKDAPAAPIAAKLDPKLGMNLDFFLNQKVDQIEVARPVTRAAFYEACWSRLCNVIKLRQPSTTTEWAQLVDELKIKNADDSKTGWFPAPPDGVTSHEFIVALTRDILAFALSNRCKAPAGSAMPDQAEWASALPIELGERRRPGNRFTFLDAQEAVRLMNLKLDELKAKAASAAGATK